MSDYRCFCSECKFLAGDESQYECTAPIPFVVIEALAELWNANESRWVYNPNLLIQCGCFKPIERP